MLQGCVGEGLQRLLRPYHCYAPSSSALWSGIRCFDVGKRVGLGIGSLFGIWSHTVVLVMSAVGKVFVLLRVSINAPRSLVTSGSL